MSRVGSALTKSFIAGDRTESQVTASWRPIRIAKASSPLARATLSERRTVANVEPRATVTTRSKALVLKSVRLPYIRGKKIGPT